MGYKMKRLGRLTVAAAFLFAVFAPIAGIWTQQTAADAIAGETFQGTSTQANQWTSGGTPGACLTAAQTDASNSIPACADGAIDADGEGALRLTNAVNDESGFAFYNTAIPSNEGLRVSFDMFQYGATGPEGADGISFFLIDGDASPTVPGALGGALGYSYTTNPNTPGIEGGYVGVGFDRYGNFSNSSFGTGGPGRQPNIVAVRGSEASGYRYVTRTAAAGEIGNESASTRSEALRHVVVSISTQNVLTVQVDYNDGQGLVTELSGIDLTAIAGQGPLPETFKFGFAASTGGSNNIHEIQGLTIDPLDPMLTYAMQEVKPFKQDENGESKFIVTNQAGGESTIADIHFKLTLPAGIKPTAAQGDGWTCSVAGQVVNCSRPGSGAHALHPGDSAPPITVTSVIDENADSDDSLSGEVELSTNGVTGTLNEALDLPITIEPSTDNDTVSDSIEDTAPNDGDGNDDGTPDADQPEVTSLPNSLTGSYTVVESAGCDGNSNVAINAATGTDKQYLYPAGLTNFTVTCATPGSTATMTLYYYGMTARDYTVRKYNSVTKQYADVQGATTSHVVISGQQVAKVSYSITDGGPLDEDGAANSAIVDPVGIAVKAAAIAAPNTGLPAAHLWLPAGAATLGLAILSRELRSALRGRRLTSNRS